MGELVRAGELDIWVEQVGEGPDVLLIGGLGDTVESWQFQLDGLADRYRLTAFDNRGVGRTAMPSGPVSVEQLADDAAGILRALEMPFAHVAGFSGGSIVSQELALRHPQLVRSLVLQSTWKQRQKMVKKGVRRDRSTASPARDMTVCRPGPPLWQYFHNVFNRLDLPPEGIDAGVPLVRHLLASW